GRAVAAVCGLPSRAVPCLPIDACAVRRLVQSRDVRNRLPVRLHAGPRRRRMGCDRASALAGTVAGVRILPVISRPAVNEGRGMPLKIYAGIAYGFYQWHCIVAV